MSLELANYGKKVDEELNMKNFRYTYNTAIDAEQLQKSLQQMLSPKADQKEDDLRLLMDEYIKYKKRYVKHLQFNPDNHNLSKFSPPQYQKSTDYLSLIHI